MSYTPYTSTPPPAGQTATSPATYAYGTYPYSHPQTPGTYTYPAGAYQAGVTGYGWTYPYSYVPQHPQAPRPQGVQTAYTPTPTLTPQRTTTFTAYAPSYAKENVSSSAQTGAGRGNRRQSNLKGLFTKERKLIFFCNSRVFYKTCDYTVKNLMYGFGDDRNPANDTVGVMEEILIEYITDVVCFFPCQIFFTKLSTKHSAKLPLVLHESHVYRSTIFVAFYQDQQMQRNLQEWKSSFSCKKILNVHEPNLKSPTSIEYYSSMASPLLLFSSAFSSSSPSA
jgi:transcription initiation factor TFIID subunit 13